MLKLAACILAICFACTGTAQEGFLVLKKKKKTIRSWMTGGDFTFTHKRGFDMSGLLVGTAPDSIYLRSYQIIRYANEKGFVFFDTLYTGVYAIGLDEIANLYIPNNKKFAFRTSEYTAYLGAGVFSVQSLINSAKFDDKSSILTEIAWRGGGLFLLGRVFHWLGRSDYRMGRKYRLHTINFAGQ
jgi:hypothetical protein